ncbi:MAG: TylF/MycF/NovP-related O-methyltransferase [bacterium]|nr:TylF/MycF/NovP-related O-methyltransferase [bacterium]
MFVAKLRYYVMKPLPAKLRGGLVRALPNIISWAERVFLGVDSFWSHDEEFIKLYNEISDKSLMDKRRAWILYNFAKKCKFLEGSFAELGVYKGAGSRILYEASGKTKNIFAFDTFEGLPETDPQKDPFWKKGDLREINYEEVRRFLHEDSFKLIKGYFPESTRLVPDKMTYSFVHIDADIYKSTKDACEYFYPKMTHGGVMLFDDYLYLSCPGVREVVDTFFKDKKEKPIPFTTGQCFVYKE